MTQILVAGIGNIFMGDDAFGVEVAQRLAKRPHPDGVKVVDFGIRGIDLTYALLDGYDAVILIDTAQLGEPPGTVRIVVPEFDLREPLAPEGLLIEPHDLDLAKVLRLAAALGDSCRRILLVACEPATFGNEDADAMGLSPEVAAAVDQAIAVVEKLIFELLEPRRSLADGSSIDRPQDRFQKLGDPSQSSTGETIQDTFASGP
jgi:hydrogenase maturation protease